MIAWLLSTFVAYGAVVTDVPAGATTIDVLVCLDESDCDEQAEFLSARPGEDRRTTVPLGLLLSSPSSDEQAKATFDAALKEGKAAVDEEQWHRADTALDRAERALRRTSAPVSTNDLYTLWFLEGEVAVEQGDDGTAAFAQAAAVAWNKDVRPLSDDPGVLAGWREGLREAVRGSATVHLGAPPEGAVYAIDGVPLEGRELRLDVLPGVHRLTATSPSGNWRQTVRVGVGQEVAATASFPKPVDPDWVAEGLRSGATKLTASEDLRKWLAAWCDDHGVREVRVVVVTEDKRGRMTGTKAATFRTDRRRFER